MLLRESAPHINSLELQKGWDNANTKSTAVPSRYPVYDKKLSNQGNLGTRGAHDSDLSVVVFDRQPSFELQLV